MQFPVEFFNDEIRDDFHIEALMKCAWAVQMEILDDIRSLCQKNNIRFFADGGTLLGTIRHHGYVPWDDDIDIAMLRPDYDRFTKCIQTVWNEKYSLFIPGVTENYNMTFTKIYNNDAISFEEKDLLRFHGFPYITGVDIFPIDLIPDDMDERDAFFQLYLIVINACAKWKDSTQEIMECLDDIEKLCGYKLDRNQNIPRQLCLLADLISKSYDGSDNSNMTMLAYCNQKVILKKEWYSRMEWKPFEMMMLPVPCHYHEVLTAWYGDYMKPVKGTATHDYPFYKKEMEILEENIVREVYGIDGLKQEKKS